MNNILKKTFKGLNACKENIPKNFYIQKIIKRMEMALNIEYSNKSAFNLLDSYVDIDMILFAGCNLSDYEAGYIMNKLMKFNYKVDSSERHVVARYEAFEERGLTVDKANEIIEKYYSGEYGIDNEEFKLLEEILENESKTMKPVKDAYLFLQDFEKKNFHTDKEYSLLLQHLEVLKMPKRLLTAYISYLKTKEKKPEIEAPKNINPAAQNNTEVLPSKRKLKERFNELYHATETNPYFDLKDIREVLKLIKLLSIADERVIIILNSLYRCAVKNNNYYEYLINKAEYMNKYNEQLQQISELQSMYDGAEEDLKKEIEEWLNEIYSSLEYVMIESFDYEKELAKKPLELSLFKDSVN